MTDDIFDIIDSGLPYVEDKGPADTSHYVKKNQWWTGNKGIVAIAVATGQSYWDTRQGLERAQDTLKDRAKQQRTKDKFSEYIPERFDSKVAKLYMHELDWVWMPSPVVKGQ